MTLSPTDDKQNLIALSKDELQDFLTRRGIAQERMRARQIWHWLYTHGANDFAAMTSLTLSLRQQLAEIADVARPNIATCQKSSDGTIKWLLDLHDGNQVETVFIPEKAYGKERGTLCVSSQVGCTLSCRFCHTGTQTLVRNLTAAEIVAQLMLARDELQDWHGPPAERKISNIVMMGMGEPLYNSDNVIAALKILSDSDGIAISRRRITLSTAGVAPEIHRIGEECGVLLAISLHACHDELRNQLVPLNKKYPLKTLLEAVRNYPGLHNTRRVTWEYVMLKDINDSPEDAKALLKLIRGIPSKINLIPFNPWPDSPYECSSPEAIQRFADIIWKAGYSSPVRTPRGQDILAACGQLKSASRRVPKHKQKPEETAEVSALQP